MTRPPPRRVDPFGEALYHALQDEEDTWQGVLEAQRALDAAWVRYQQAERRSASVGKAAARHINRLRSPERRAG